MVKKPANALADLPCVGTVSAAVAPPSVAFAANSSLINCCLDALNGHRGMHLHKRATVNHREISGHTELGAPDRG